MTLNPVPVSRLRTNVVNGPLTMSRAPLELSEPLCHGRPMQGRATRAGGCFLTLCILGGLAAGIAIDNPMKGILIGTATGAVLAVLLWLADRRRA